MRTDSTRVSEQAHRGRARLHRREVRRGVRAGQAQRLQDEGRRAGRARSDPADVHAVRPGVRAGAAHARSVLPVPFDLEPLRRLPDAARDVRRDDGRHSGGRLPVPRQGLGAQVRRLAGGLQPGDRRGPHRRTGPRRGVERGRGRQQRAARAQRRGHARFEGAEAGAEVHAAPAALQRGDARQGARRERHRPAEHVRVDHRRHPGARLREQDRRALQADDARDDARREAPQPRVRRHPRRRVHAQPRRGSRQDRGRDVDLQDDARRASTRSSRRTSSSAETRHAQHEGRRRADRRVACDKCGKPHGHQGRQVRPVPRLQRLSGLREHARAREARAGRRRRGHRGSLRELRQADGRQARPLRPVPRLHRLSRVQDDAQDHHDQAGHDRREAGPDPRREVPEVRARTSC